MSVFMGGKSSGTCTEQIGCGDRAQHERNQVERGNRSVLVAWWWLVASWSNSKWQLAQPSPKHGRTNDERETEGEVAQQRVV